MPENIPAAASAAPAEPPSSRDSAYAWLIVLLAAAAMAATLPGRTHGLGLITKHLLIDFPSLSETDFGRINFWATLIGAAFCLPCGWLLDRFGIRIVLTAVMATLSAVVLWMSTLHDLPLLVVAITLSRGVGQSMLSVISITMIGKWFQQRLGMAMGAFSVQMSLLMAVMTGVSSQRINTAGWRTGWHELGLELAIAVPVFALLAFDPHCRRTGSVADDPPAPEASATLFQALTCPCFWVFALSISFFGMVSAGISLWQQLILEERGLPAGVFTNVLIIGLLVGMVVNLIAGWLAQFVRLSHLLAAAMLLLAVAFLILPLARTPLQAYAFAVVQGVAGGMLTVLFFAVWRHAFGPGQLGRIQGAAQMLTVFASALGPLIVAESNASAGTYAWILYLFAAVSIGFAAIALVTRVPDARTGVWLTDALLPPTATPLESPA